jgi:hypothetical protein
MVSSIQYLMPTLLTKQGLYIFKNSSTSNVIAMASPITTPVAMPRDLEAFSINGRLQVWIVEQNRENWYKLKNFAFGVSLSASTDPTPHLISGVDDGSNSFQWKFLQDTASSTLRCVPRSRQDLALASDANGILSLVTYSGDPIQRFVLYFVSIGCLLIKFVDGK